MGLGRLEGAFVPGRPWHSAVCMLTSVFLHQGLGTHSQAGVVFNFIYNIKMFKCQQSGVQTSQGRVPICFCLEFNITMTFFDKLAVDSVVEVSELFWKGLEVTGVVGKGGSCGG